MTVELQEITIPPVRDITQHALNRGDTDVVKQKMDDRDTLINAVAANLRTLGQQVSQLRSGVSGVLNENNAAIDSLDPNGFALNLFPGAGSLLESEGRAGGVVLGHEGKFTGRDDLLDMFTSYNGTDVSMATEVARFYYNSSTFGGSGPEVTGSAGTFSEEMFSQSTISNSQKRFIPSFAIAELICGNGQNGLSYDNKHSLVNSIDITRIASASRQISAAIWYQPLDDDAFIKSSFADGTQTVYLDGVKLEPGGGDSGSDYYRIIKHRVAHIAVSWDSSGSSVASFLMGIVAAAGSRNRFAIPVMVPGAYKIKPHFMPVASLLNAPSRHTVDANGTTKDTEAYYNRMPEAADYPVGYDLTVNGHAPVVDNVQGIGRSTSFYKCVQSESGYSWMEIKP